MRSKLARAFPLACALFVGLGFLRAAAAGPPVLPPGVEAPMNELLTKTNSGGALGDGVRMQGVEIGADAALIYITTPDAAFSAKLTNPDGCRPTNSHWCTRHFQLEVPGEGGRELGDRLARLIDEVVVQDPWIRPSRAEVAEVVGVELGHEQSRRQTLLGLTLTFGLGLALLVVALRQSRPRDDDGVL